MVSLLIGVKSDPVLQYFFQQRYVQKDRGIIFINTERIGCDILLSSQGWQLPCGEFVPHTAVCGVYNRILSSSRYRLAGYLNWLLDEYYPNVINRPRDTLTNFSKLWQLEQASLAGFYIPETEVFANYSLYCMDKKQYIFKSISSIRSIVMHASDNPQNKVHEPVVFQLDKGRTNIRVHVIGHTCFAQEITSAEVDYRYDLFADKARDFELPNNLKAACIKLASQMNLFFAGIDFMLHEGCYFFLEMNPSPGYAYFEKQMKGTPLSQCLYNSLKA